MHLFPLILFLTLVGSPGHGAPHQEAAPPGFSPEDEVSQPPLITSFRVSWKARPPERLQVHAGLLSGDLIERDTLESSAFVGLLYFRKVASDEAWDVSADFATRSWLRLGGGKRFYMGSDRGHLPYLRLGASQTVELKGFPAGALDPEPLKISWGLGFGNLFNENENWSAQFDLQWGSLGGALQFTLGWNFDLSSD